MSPPSASNRMRFARRPTLVKRWPASEVIGGSIVFTVAKCATGIATIGSAVSASRWAITNASSSGSSGTRGCYASTCAVSRSHSSAALGNSFSVAGASTATACHVSAREAPPSARPSAAPRRSAASGASDDQRSR